MIWMFLLGLLVGGLLVVGITILALNRAGKELEKQAKKDIEFIMQDAEKVAYAKLQMKELEKIADKQMSLISSMDIPSKSASHSRYKNQIAKQIKELEKDKVDIFKEILSTGIDPIVSLIGADGEKKDIRMSEAVDMHQESSEDLNTPSKSTDPISPSRNETGLRLVKGEKSDGNKPDSKTIH